MRGRIPVLVAAGSLAVLVALVLYFAGRPLATNDLWWHLSMGRAYAAEGLHLEADPSLHTARETPPQPAAWLFALGVHGVERAVGFPGLRVLHVLVAAAIVALAFSLFRREGATPVETCLATAVFLVLAWTRLYQLRPDLASILATLGLYRLLLEPQERPGWGRVAAAAAVLALWANTHPVFMLGPCLLVAALLGYVLRALLAKLRLPADAAAEAVARELARARRISAALVLGLAAALANPRGVAQHLTFLRSAGEGAIWTVRDDWTPFDPRAWDRYGITAGFLEWLVADLLLLAFLVAAAAGAVRFLRRPSARTLDGVDPVLFGLGLASVVAAGVGVRFLWLACFPLLFLLRAHRCAASKRPGAPLTWGLAAACVALAVALPASSGFARFAASLPRPLSAYLATPYASMKYHEHGVAFLEATGVEGKLFNAYWMGGYLGYRLAPRLRTFLDGSMNVDYAVFLDYSSVNRRRGTLPGERFEEVLDRRGVDVFFGVGAPPSLGGYQSPYTSEHLAGAPGWLLVARGPRYAVYLRDNARNARNVERVAAHYAREGIPFDRERGLDVSRVLRERPDWAVEHGLLPRGYEELLAARESPDPSERFRSLVALGGAYARIGAHAEQVEVDREALALRPGAEAIRHRLEYGRQRLAWADAGEGS